MAVIDQRILIAAPVELIWLYLTEPAHISRWHRGAKQLLVLTTRPGGIGARWRCVNAHGRSLVEEITAWLEPMGYEYRIVDGPYKAFIGRIRIQPVPDGTQVQWTVDYRMRGVLSGLRDQFGHRRSLRNQMTDSLRGLRRLIEASGVRFDPNKHAKSAMQDDPGILARRARTTDPAGQNAVMTLPPASLRAVAVDVDDIPEIPAISPAPPIPDTTPAVTSIPTLPPRSAMNTVVPGQSTADSKDDTKPRPPAGLSQAIATLAPAPVTDELRQEDTPAHLDKGDTGEMSIWDIFGLERPSQRNKAELEAVIASLQTPPPRPLARSDSTESEPAQAPVDQPALPPDAALVVAEPVSRHMPTSVKARVAVRRLAVPAAHGLRTRPRIRRQHTNQ